MITYNSTARAAAAMVLTILGACGGDTINTTEAGATCDEATSVLCSCEDGQIGEQSCTDGVPGECLCPDPIPPEQCRSDLDCSDGLYCNGVERCDPGTDGSDAIGCTAATRMPDCDDGVSCTADRCDNDLNRCISEAPDQDGDGHRDGSCNDADGEPLGDDCDDDDADRYPGNLEVCADGNYDHDEDCNDETFGVLDLDADGATDDRCCNGDRCGGDCDDTTIARRIGQPEFCDNRDNDCDGETDEETGAVPWFIDGDGDGFGSVAEMDTAIDQCIPVPGRSLLATDCNDQDPGKHPAQLERCDLRDNNCNLIADETAQCPYEPFEVAPDDLGGVNVGGDPPCPPFGYEDLDGDGFGNNDTAMSLDPDAPACALPADWVTKGNDCDDGNGSRNPGAVDVCDSVDNNCDDVVDEEPVASAACNLANIAAECIFGQCVPKQGEMCTAPYADCDGLVASGCETDTRASARHCGGCNMACGLGDLCVDSLCAGTPYQQIVAGENHNLVLRPGGLLGWGQSTDGQLGTSGNVGAPIRVGSIGNITQITAGEFHNCLRQGGSVMCWGNNANGQIGNGNKGSNDVSVPTQVMGIQDAVLVQAGADHSCAIREDQTVWCWGRAGHGQLGYSATPATDEVLPVQVVGIDDAIDLGLGDSFTCVLHAGGTVSCFGEDDNGRLGWDSGANQNEHLPVAVSGLTNATRLASGGGSNQHMCAIQATGSVVCWGYNIGGQLGNQSKTDAYAPSTFAGVSNAKEVSTGFGHTCVVETDGDLWCAGYDDVAQLGDVEDQNNGQWPKQVDLGAEGASLVACGRRHTCAVLLGGSVICFGSNQYGQVGAGAFTGSTTGVYPYREILPAP